MAKYIPPGVAYQPTIIERSGTLMMTKPPDDKDFMRFARSLETREPIILDGTKIFMLSMERHEIAPKIIQAVFEFEISGEPSRFVAELLQQFGQAELRMIQNYDTYQHDGYIERDVELTHTIDDTHIVRLWDIPADEDGNEWEVALLENRPYWCDDCDDEHDSWDELETYQFKTRDEAEGKYSEYIHEPRPD